MNNWYAGWYASRLHFVKDGIVDGGTSVGVCGAHVYHAPPSRFAQRRIERGVSKCAHCLRILGMPKMVEVPAEELAAMERVVEAVSDRAGSWMSACLSDDTACDEIKSDFGATLQALHDLKVLRHGENYWEKSDAIKGGEG